MARERGRLTLAAVDEAAAAAGLAPGMPLAGAHALAPDLETAAHEPESDAAALARLAAWCERYSPWTAPGGLEPGGAAGLLLDVTGCAHLWGGLGDGPGGSPGDDPGNGEAALLADATARLADLGFSARPALAGTLGAAWALARFAPAGEGPPGESSLVVAPGRLRAALAPLPPAALRLPAETCELLARFGLRRIADLFELPPATLVPRFGPLLARRLRQALGEETEPLSPGTPPPPPLVHRLFAEPIVTPEDLARSLAELSTALCRRLEAEGLGARRLVLAAYRVDGGVQRLVCGTSRPRRDPDHLARLFADKLERLDPGFGVEVMTLAAPASEPLAPRQVGLAGEGAAATGETGDGGLADFLDRLESRFGPGCAAVPGPRESHLPERAVEARPPLAALREGLREVLGEALARAPAPRAWRRACPRPLRLFDPPQPVEALALLPDRPPVRFRWRRLQHRVVRAEGPERLTGEWWRDDGNGAGETPREQAAGAVSEREARDYFRVEDQDGRRYWLYRQDGRWFLHGLFA